MIIWNLLFYAVLCFRLINIYKSKFLSSMFSLSSSSFALQLSLLSAWGVQSGLGTIDIAAHGILARRLSGLWGWIDWLICVIHNTRIIGIHIFLFRIDCQNPSKWFITNAGFMFYPVGRHCGGGNLWGCCADVGQRWEGERPESWLGSWLPPQWWEWHSAEWAECSLVIFKTEFVYCI